MEKLIEKLNNAAEAYYNGNEIMSNFEYDALYDKLLQMEKETGVVLPNSPTQNVGSKVVEYLPKIRHEYPMLSLDKTKDVEQLRKTFEVRDNLAILMWKMDGSTVVATYDDGKLQTLATRGNGEEGSVITHNAPYIKGLPMTIAYKGHLVVRGEAVMTYSEFERINKNLSEEEQYANPRNLATATIQMLDSGKMSEREIQFYAFNLVSIDTGLSPDTFAFRLLFLKNQGFQVVEADCVDATDDFARRIEEWSDSVSELDYPVDGLVIALNDVVYAEMQPGTGHNPNKLVGYAFKWQDETVETVLRDIEWSPSRTGLLNPVAVFDPVDLEGTTVTRASLHNVSYIMDKDLRIGDTITVFKANKIIPQIADNLSSTEERQKVKISSNYALIHECPVCKEVTGIHENNDTLTLHCNNPFCPAKMVGKFVHFCERDCMNIEGMSEATIERFVEKGFIKEYADLFKLDRFRLEIVAMEGFGQKSYENIIAATNKARTTDFVSFIHALGIPNIGKGQAKLFNKEYKGDIIKFFKDVQARHNFQHIDGIGEVLEKNLWDWGNKYLKFVVLPEEDSYADIKNLMPLLVFKKEEVGNTGTALEGLTFVITGDVTQFKNRAELQAFIEANGGKTTGSVTGKTNYLINNDVTSTSGKNKKAKEMNIPIISETEFLSLVNN